MNELTVDEFFEVYNMFRSGEEVSKILSREFPSADITVLLGTTKGSGDHYVQDAFLFRDTMSMALEDLKKDRRFSAKPYFLTRGTIEDIEECSVYALPFPRQLKLSQADQMNIYSRLENNFRQRARLIEKIN